MALFEAEKTVPLAKIIGTAHSKCTAQYHMAVAFATGTTVSKTQYL